MALGTRGAGPGGTGCEDNAHRCKNFLMKHKSSKNLLMKQKKSGKQRHVIAKATDGDDDDDDDDDENVEDTPEPLASGV